MDRLEQAAAILQRFQPGRYEYLGAGFAGVVFHDGRWVYKVHIPLTAASYGEEDHLLYLSAKLDSFRGARHFYPLRELACQDGTYILVYPYEESESVDEATEEEWYSYLAEMWERRLISRSVKLSTNFRRARGVLKLVDYEIEPYDDNLFLNVAARAFIQLPRARDRVANASKLRRSMINRFDLPELDGFFSFLARICSTIAARASAGVWDSRREKALEADLRGEHFEEVAERLHPLRAVATASLPVDAVDPHEVAFRSLQLGFRLHDATIEPPAAGESPDAPLRVRLLLAPMVDPPSPVSLLIKACIQDTDRVEDAVRHIVRGLSGPQRFTERVLALDLVARERFPRQYTTSGTAEELLAAARRLVEAGVIDRVVSSPTDDAAIAALNRRWFGIESTHSHTTERVPVAPHLHAFESMATEAFLQVDVDALIGVRDPDHPYLTDMLRVFDEAPHVMSVAFPICRPAAEGFQPYFGFEGGGFVPEVRCCLLRRSRLEALRPLPNESRPKGLAKSWYRSVEARQRETGACSVRGGPTARFFIHPQNYRKAAPTTWPTLIDRVEQGAVPSVQEGEPEVRGSLLDWCLPCRAEDTVVVGIIEEETPAEICRFLLGLEAQSCSEFGILLIDNSGRRRAAWIARAIGFDNSRLTVIDRHERGTKPAAVMEAVRRYVARPDALICLLDAGDLLLGSHVIGELRNRLHLYESDVLVGKEVSEEALPRLGKHSLDFVEPRRDPEAFADGLRVIRRSLLDALDLRDLQVRRGTEPETNTFARLSRSHAWVDDPHLLTLVVPAVELSQNPIRFDHFNVLRRRAAAAHGVMPVVLDLLRSRPSKREGAWVVGRKAFAPNLRRIELDITYDCNLKCVACNRSCTQAPTREHMTLEQVRAFVAESIALNKRWEFINVLGGEPTLHPDFQGIIDVLLREYVDASSPDTVVQITSNGYGAFVQRQLEELPVHPRLVVNRDSFKDSDRVPYFTPFNDAPADDPAFASADFRKGCWVTSYCGLGLNHLGYFACSVAGGIERLLGAGRGVRSLAEVDASIAETLDTYCRLCGNFKHYEQSRGDFVPRSEKDVCEAPVVSPTWRKLYGG